MKKIFISFVCIAFGLQLFAQGYVSTFVGPFNQGVNDGMVLAPDGTLYGTDHEGTKVYKVTPEGNVSSIAQVSTHPNAIIMDDAGNLYFSEPPGNKIYKIEPGGEVSQYGPDIPNPNGLIFDLYSDTLYVTSYLYNTIVKLAPDGVVVPFIDDDQLDGPLGLTYDDNEVMYVSNFNDGKMFKIVDGQLEYFVTIPGGYLGSNYFSTGYIQYINGYIYATGFVKNKVYKVDMEGNIEEFAGSGVAGSVDGPLNSARFYYPNGIISNPTGDTIYISDYETKSIRMITGFTTDINENKSDVPSKVKILVEPNPATVQSTLHIESVDDQNVNVRIFDVNGNNIASSEEIYNTLGLNKLKLSEIVNISNIKQGTYLCVVYSGKYVIGSTKFLIDE